MWAPWNPNEEFERMRQGESKVMAWCGLVDGRMLEVRCMDKKGRPRSVTSERCQNMMQQHVWNQSSCWNYWFMQDGVTSHMTNLNINFLIKKFCGRVISRRSPLGHSWPPYSPDLNPLDYVWRFIKDQVWRIQPESIKKTTAG